MRSGEIFSTPYVVIEYIEGEPEFALSDVTEVLPQIEGYLDTSAMGDASVPTPTQVDVSDASVAHTRRCRQTCAAHLGQGDASVPTLRRLM